MAEAEEFFDAPKAAVETPLEVSPLRISKARFLQDRHRSNMDEFRRAFMAWLLDHPERIFTVLKSGNWWVMSYPSSPFRSRDGGVLGDMALIITLAMHIPSGEHSNLETEGEIQDFLQETTTQESYWALGWLDDADDETYASYRQIGQVCDSELIDELHGDILAYSNGMIAAPSRVKQVFQAFGLCPPFDLVMHTAAASVLTMSTVSDELTVANGTDDASRFWRIAGQLPLDMQIELASKYTSLWYGGFLNIVNFPSHIMRAADLEVTLFLENMQ